jgi:hypothetical protein
MSIYADYLNHSINLNKFDCFIDEYDKRVVNAPIKMLVNSLEDISLNMRDIVFIDTFNQHINECTWPESLTSIDFGYNFDQSISLWDVSYLPYNLTRLILSHNFTKIITKYPSKLTHVYYGYRMHCHISDLPDSLQFMSFNRECWYNSFIKFPNNLAHLHLGYAYNYALNDLPQSLTHLVTSMKYNIELLNLPLNLIYLEIGNSYNKPLNLLYLNSLKTLILLNIVNLQNIIFSDNLQIIAFEYKFIGNIANVKWPSNLTYIVDSSNTITIKSCTFPKSLYRIIHNKGIHYIRDTGKNTKGASTTF